MSNGLQYWMKMLAQAMAVEEEKLEAAWRRQKDAEEARLRSQSLRQSSAGARDRENVGETAPIQGNE